MYIDLLKIHYIPNKMNHMLSKHHYYCNIHLNIAIHMMFLTKQSFGNLYKSMVILNKIYNWRNIIGKYLVTRNNLRNIITHMMFIKEDFLGYMLRRWWLLRRKFDS